MPTVDSWFSVGNGDDRVRRGRAWSERGRPVFWREGDDPRYAADVAYVLERGPLPDGKEAVQTCGNVACMNPAHLELRDA